MIYGLEAGGDNVDAQPQTPDEAPDSVDQAIDQDPDSAAENAESDVGDVVEDVGQALQNVDTSNLDKVVVVTENGERVVFKFENGTESDGQAPEDTTEAAGEETEEAQEEVAEEAEEAGEEAQEEAEEADEETEEGDEAQESNEELSDVEQGFKKFVEAMAEIAKAWREAIGEEEPTSSEENSESANESSETNAEDSEDAFSGSIEASESTSETSESSEENESASEASESSETESSDVDRIQEQLDDPNVTYESLKADLEDVGDEEDDLDEEMDEVDDEMEDLDEQIGDKKAQLRELKQQLIDEDTPDDQRDNLERQISDMEGEIQLLNQKYDVREQRWDDVYEDKMELKAQAEQDLDTLDKMWHRADDAQDALDRQFSTLADGLEESNPDVAATLRGIDFNMNEDLRLSLSADNAANLALLAEDIGTDLDSMGIDENGVVQDPDKLFSALQDAGSLGEKLESGDDLRTAEGPRETLDQVKERLIADLDESYSESTRHLSSMISRRTQDLNEYSIAVDDDPIASRLTTINQSMIEAEQMYSRDNPDPYNFANVIRSSMVQMNNIVEQAGSEDADAQSSLAKFDIDSRIANPGDYLPEAQLGLYAANDA